MNKFKLALLLSLIGSTTGFSGEKQPNMSSIPKKQPGMKLEVLSEESTTKLSLKN